MSESIAKLQPTRTMHLRGFDRRGAAASFVALSDSEFYIYGVFRDMADFAVLTLWDADDFFEHPRLKYLPDFDFTGITLGFDLQYSGLQPIDSCKYNWIDWATIDIDGVQFKLKDYATISGGGSLGRAEATVSVVGSSIQAFDRVSLIYGTFPFDYIVPGVTSFEFSFYAGGPGTGHTISIGYGGFGGYQNDYTVTEPPHPPEPLWSSSDVVDALVAAVNAGAGDPRCVASIGSATNKVKLTPKIYDGSYSAGQGSDGGEGTVSIYGVDAEYVAQYFTDAINAADYSSVTMPLTATRSGAAITIKAGIAGEDGNRVGIYTLHKTATLAFSSDNFYLTGGSSSVVWSVSLPFGTGSLPSSIRKMWMTFAPHLPLPAAAYVDTEWNAHFTSWSVTDTSDHRALKVAGPGSVRVDSRDAWARYAGTGWSEETGWFQGGFARRASKVADGTNPVDDSVSVEYHCQHVHDLYVGTSLYSDRGVVSVLLDNVSQADLNCSLGDDPAVVTRRRIASSVAAGAHTVILTLKPAPGGGSPVPSGYFYFDFLESAVPADVPGPDVTYTGVTAAIDYDTDHSYKLPPARLLWNLDKLGLHGAVNEYLGVFWWNQRVRSGGGPKAAVVTFGGTWASGDTATLQFDDSALVKLVFPADTLDTIAQHFVYAINSTFIAVWAEKTGTGEITIRQYSPIWDIVLAKSKVSAAGTVTVTPTSNPIQAATEGTWEIDTSASDPINYPTRMWHADLYSRLASLGWGVVTSLSMELVDPPEATGAVYAARFPDGTAVTTDTGFANLHSVHCAPSAAVLALQQTAFTSIADLQAAAGLVPYVQFGEFLWWFFPRYTGIGMLGVSNTSPIEITTIMSHGRATGETVILSGVRGNTAANGTWTITVTAPNKFTLDGSAGNGAWTGQGYMRYGGMAYYDAETAAAALVALGRALATFWTQDDDPAAVHSGADADFLAARLAAHVAAIRSAVLAAHGSARFELLYPDDVNNSACYATLDFPWPQGGRLNHRVNTPAAWTAKTGSGLDRMKVEALSWGATYRNKDAAAAAIDVATTDMTWPKADTAYLMPIYDPGCAWPAEYLRAMNRGTPLIVLWAFDHIALYSWPWPLPENAASATTL